MAISIGKLNVVLTASAAGFAAALGGAEKRLGGFGSSVTATAGLFQNALGAFEVGALVGKVTSLTKSSLESIDTLKDQAESIGITTKALSEFQYAASFAGVNAETLNASLGKMQKNVADAAAGTGAAKDAFAALGLDASKLSALPTDEKFRQIADALSRVENPAQKVALSMDIFGKSGRALIPVLNGGSEGLNKFAAEAQALGVSISDVDAAKVEAANDSLAKIDKAITGVGNTLAVALAPYIEAAAKKIVEFTTAGGGIGPKIGSALEFVVKGIAYVSDYLNIAVAGFKLLQSGAAFAIAGVVKAVDFLGAGVVKFLNLFPGVNLQWTETFGAMGDALIDEGKKLASEAGQAFDDFSNGKASKAVSDYFQTIKSNAEAAAQATADSNKALGGSSAAIEAQSKSAAEIAKVIDGLQAKLNQKETGEDPAIAKLKALGAGAEQIAQAQALVKQYEELNKAQEENKRLGGEAAKVKEEIQTPLEKAQERLETLKKLYESGRLSADEFAKAQAKVSDDLDKATEDKNATKEVTAPKLVAQGSNEAFKLVSEIQARMEGRGNDVPNKQLAQQIKANTVLEQIRDAVKTTSGGSALAEIGYV